MRSNPVLENLFSRRIFWCCALAVFLCARPAMSWAQASAGGEDGLYTSGQAEQGKRLYGSRCAACHGAALEGLTAPALAGPRFEKHWISTTTLDDLFFLMRTTMPQGMAQSLSAEQHAVIFAYILQQNGYPAGTKPVQLDTPQLKTTGVLSRTVQSRRGAAPSANTSDPKNFPSEPPPSFIPGDAKSLPTSGGPTQEQLNAAVGSGQD